VTKVLQKSEIHQATEDDLVARAAGLGELLRKEAPLGEERRNITDVAASALREAGLFHLGVPRRWGGQEASVRTSLLVTAELARADASVGWIAMIFADGASAARLCSDQAQQEIWGDNRDAMVTGVFTPAGKGEKVNGGFKLSGKWSFNSGCLHAHWAMLAFPVFAADGSVAEVNLALVPYKDVAIEDTWFVAGMRATASQTVVGTDVFVPQHRVISFADLEAGRLEPGGYPSPASSALIFLLLGPLLGMGRAAVDLARQTIDKGRPVTGSFYQKAADAPTYYLNYATAVSKVDTAHLHALRAADDLDHAAAKGIRVDELGRGRIRMDIAVALQSLRDAVTISLGIGGAASFATANPIQRVWRDFETASRHAYFNPSIGHECYARALLGIQPPIANF